MNTALSTAASQEVTLRFPVTVDAETYKSLSVRRAIVADQLRAAKAFPSDDNLQAVRMAALLAGVSDDVIEALDLADFAAVSKVVSGFMDLSSEKTS